MEGDENQEYIISNSVIGHSSSSPSSLDTEEEKCKDKKAILKTDGIDFEGKDFLKDLIQCVKSGNKICDPQTDCPEDNVNKQLDLKKNLSTHMKPENKVRALKTNFKKENPVDRNDEASFIEELKKLAHDVEDNKSETRHHLNSIKLAPVMEIVSQHKQTVELRNKQEFCFTSALTNHAKCKSKKRLPVATKSNNAPVKVKEELLCDNETDNLKVLSNKLHSYKQIEKGQQICEMLFSHIPIADNSLTEEIYVSKVSEISTPSKPLNTNIKHDKALCETTEKITDCDIATSSKPVSSVCRMPIEDSTDKDEDKITEPPANCSQPLQTSESAANEHSSASSSCSLQTGHSLPETNSRLNQLFSSCDLVTSSADELSTNSNTSISVNIDETSSQVHNISSQSSEYARKANEPCSIANSKTRKFKCSECDKAFDLKSTLNKHLLIHGNRKFLCLICGKAYTQKETLDEHNLFEHSGEQSTKFKCPECNKAFNNKQCLRRHQHNKHKTDRSTVDLPSTCRVCKKTFKSRKHVATHQRFLHGSEAEQFCNECSMVFNYKPKLMAHLKAKH